MKIAFLNFYSGHVKRGGETFIHELTTRLSPIHKIVVFQSDQPIKDPFSSLPTTHIVRRLFLDRPKLRELIFTFRTLPSLLKFRPEIVFPVNGGWQSLIVSIYCRLSGAKMVIVGHSGPGWDDRWNLLMKPHLFIALTMRQLDWAQKATIWKQEFALIPNGVDLDRFRPGGISAKLDLEKPIIIMVAATTLAKRVEQGIRAVSSLKSGSLLLLGSGPLDERIDNLGYKLLGKKRFLHTSVDYDLTPQYYRAADLFTLVSDSSEAFGIVYLEAMACGLACVATDDDSRREIIGQAGVFVKDPDNADEYAKAIETALKTNWKDIPSLQAKKYSWEMVSKKYEHVLGKLLKKA